MVRHVPRTLLLALLHDPRVDNLGATCGFPTPIYSTATRLPLKDNAQELPTLSAPDSPYVPGPSL